MFCYRCRIFSLRSEFDLRTILVREGPLGRRSVDALRPCGLLSSPTLVLEAGRHVINRKDRLQLHRSAVALNFRARWMGELEGRNWTIFVDSCFFFRLTLEIQGFGIREEKTAQTQTFWSGFPADIPDPYARMPRGQKVSPHHRGRRKMHSLVRTSTIFGADVHDPKGCRKTLYKKSLRWFLDPYGSRRTLQKTADFRRKPQICAETSFSHLLSSLNFGALWELAILNRQSGDWSIDRFSFGSAFLNRFSSIRLLLALLAADILAILGVRFCNCAIRESWLCC